MVNTITTKALNCRANRVVMAKIDYITIKKTSIGFIIMRECE